MASANKGRTIYGGVLQSQINEVTSSFAAGTFGLGAFSISASFPSTVHGTYGTSSYAPGLFSGDRGNTLTNAEESARLPTPPTPSTTQATFKMTGWYATGNVYETWTSSGTPNISPPSGHTLTFVSYIVTSGAAN